jgi:UDP-N-acetylglucosamine/UDP-N-acetylgalactosamine 4-epimerase
MAKSILVTGGAGFIGSNLVEALLKDDRVGKVRVLDNLSTGFFYNIQEFMGNPKFEFVLGDVRDYNTCFNACDGIDLISHQAALGSVPRSINDPLTTNAVNITGTLNIFTAAKEKGVKRVVYAASSSTYGDSKELPKVEDKIGNPLSPYAVTKYVMELYARVYGDLYGLEHIGLRYFNVFGPKQNPTGAYAAVIPLFIQSILDGKSPTINGDGSVSRDFTYILNAVQANLLALFTEERDAINHVYNVACGERTTLKQLWEILKIVSKSSIEPIYGVPRKGDIPHSLADISKIKMLLSYEEKIKVKNGLKLAFEWYKFNELSTIKV